MADVKKKWSDLKVEAKRKVARHRRSTSATGGGSGTPELTPLDEKRASTVGSDRDGAVPLGGWL